MDVALMLPELLCAIAKITMIFIAGYRVSKMNNDVLNASYR